MGRGGESPNKRRINAQRNDRQAMKNERRAERLAAEAAPPIDEAEVMAQFHQLNELRAAGGVTDDDYERQRHEIFVLLGLEEPLDSDARPTHDADTAEST